MVWFMLCMVIWLMRKVSILSGFQKPPTGSEEALFNRQSCSIRITVEWGFRDEVEKWKFLDFCSAMKIFEMPITQMVHFSATFAIVFAEIRHSNILELFS